MCNNTIENKLNEISGEIINYVNNYDNNEPQGLYDGDAGLFLFLCKYLEYNDKFIEQTQKFSERLVENLLERTKSHTFCSGYAGILFLFKFLDQKDIITIDISKISIIEDYLFKKFKSDLSGNDYDFLHGALGVAFYAIKYRNEKFVNIMIEYLYENVKICDNGFYMWYARNSTECNISLSHGLSSIICFLSVCLQTNLDKCLRSVLVL